ncbi:MAG: zinc metalloprotease HtpX [Deltaproteobacteria bacterium]|nr:zinc metalloprotease HtpX [Deltaproteobacteria bacterium]
MTNQIKTTVLLAVLTVMILIIGQAMGGRGGLFIAFILAVIMNFGSYWFSDKIVLAIYRAEKIDPNEGSQLYATVRELAQAAGLPMPRLYLVPDESPNAFATGRNPENAVVAVTQGILNTLSQAELRGVLAHELGHIRNHDILISSIAATLAGAIMILADIGKFAVIFGAGRGDDEDSGGGIVATLVMAIVAPIAAMLIQSAISRSREFLADSAGAQISNSPESLANALLRLEQGRVAVPMDASPATAHMMIVNPLSGRNVLNLFSTHPPTEERVRRLREMEHI